MRSRAKRPKECLTKSCARKTTSNSQRRQAKPRLVELRRTSDAHRRRQRRVVASTPQGGRGDDDHGHDHGGDVEQPRRVARHAAQFGRHRGKPRAGEPHAIMRPPRRAIRRRAPFRAPRSAVDVRLRRASASRRLATPQAHAARKPPMATHSWTSGAARPYRLPVNSSLLSMFQQRLWTMETTNVRSIVK